MEIPERNAHRFPVSSKGVYSFARSFAMQSKPADSLALGDLDWLVHCLRPRSVVCLDTQAAGLVQMTDTATTTLSRGTDPT